ncbi:MAG TPA: chemotaxis protein CheW [Trichocoleus sp.]|jgi:purine-binding chemotaxis protein CheW
MMNDESTPHLVFSIADYFLALPLKNVLRVVNYPPQNHPIHNPTGFVQMGHHVLQIFDLHQWIQPSLEPKEQLFLVVTQDRQGALLGIPIDHPPDLMEFSPEAIHPLPKSQVQSGLAEIVSHAVVIPEQGISTTIFLLNVSGAKS